MEKSKTEETVLVTGATSGIGLELAKIFAVNGYRLVLVARFADELKPTADLLRTMGAPAALIIAKDLSLPGAANEIYTMTRAHGIFVDILVNDAGMGEYGFFIETNLEKEMSIIQLNIASLVHLTKLYLRDMVRAGHGRILQLASIASYEPTPKLAVYAATKSFVLSFNDALANELKEVAPNVTTTALIPNATATDFFRKAGMQHTKAAQENPEDPAVVAKIGYEALMKGELHAYAPGVKQAVLKDSIRSNESIAASARKQMDAADEDEEKTNDKEDENTLRATD